jgi:enoyl-CoA hydratase/carnithine racemase
VTDTLTLTREGHTAVLTLDNPPANTFTRDNLLALKQRVRALDADPDVYALIVTGAGDKFFSAGADLKQFANGDKGLAYTLAQQFGEAFETLSAFRGLTIAAINGYAMGGGLECALACDLRIAEEQALLALPEASVGLLPCAGGTQNLPWLVGEGWAKRIILCGERIDAATALDIGLIEQRVPTGQALASALTLAQQAARQSPQALAACKALIQAGRQQPIAANLVREREAFARLFDGEDQREGVNAFLEKRRPQWKNA